MKKGLTGCLIVFVLLAVGGGIGFYYYVYKPFVGDYVGGFMEMAQVRELNDDIQDKTAYTPPADGELSPDQVDRFLGVQDQIRGDLSKELEKLKAKYEQIEVEIEQAGRDANYREMLSAWSDVTDLVVEAKRAQVAALNRQGFSLDEYEWVKQEVYRAAGMQVPTMGMRDILRAVQDGSGPEAIQVDPDASNAVPAHNRELVKAHGEQLEEMAALAWFGL